MLQFIQPGSSKYKRTAMVFIGLFGLTFAVTANDSGGALDPEQAAYNITFYDLTCRVDSELQHIEGVLSLTAIVVTPMDWFLLDLADNFHVEQTALQQAGGSETELDFERPLDRIRIALPETAAAGQTLQITVRYSGIPAEAEMPPWNGGWVRTLLEDSRLWLGTACEQEGADLWWPCKDHPSDEPDSMAMHFRIPENLVCASNGRLRSVEDHGDGTRTWHWFSSTPINTYNVTLNIAPYYLLNDKFRNSTGDSMDIFLYLLEGDQKKASGFMAQMKKNLQFLESKFGPYPFRIDKYAVVRTSYLGMEHQTLISYGDDFELNDFGFDYVLFHETAHEWWGNLITASDWKDIWIHESFATYSEALYAEYLGGEAILHQYVNERFKPISNRKALAPRESATFSEMYNLDIYYKGARVLHTLRYLLGDTLFLDLLRRMCYPSPEAEIVQTGAQCRSVSTDDFIALTQTISGQDLTWFFEVYLRNPALPELHTEKQERRLLLQWMTDTGIIFPMPVEVAVGGDIHRISMAGGQGELEIGSQNFEIDPKQWILKTFNPETGVNLSRVCPDRADLVSVSPTPFNQSTILTFILPESGHVSLEIYNAQGQQVARLIDAFTDSGIHRVRWVADGHASGIYLARFRTRELVQDRKLILMK